MLYIEEDFDDLGFFMITSKPYDRRVRMRHTHRPNYKIKFQRHTEPDILTFYDLMINVKNVQTSNNLEERDVEMVVLGRDHSAFLIDQTMYKEKEVSQKKVEELEDKL